MEHKDENFFIALAYTAMHERDIDIIAFRQKVNENQKALSKYDAEHPSKAHIRERSDLGI